MKSSRKWLVSAIFLFCVMALIWSSSCASGPQGTLGVSGREYNGLYTGEYLDRVAFAVPKALAS